MLITIDTGSDTFVIYDRKPPRMGLPFVVQGGMDGVLGVPVPKTETVDAPLADGSFEPARILTDSRTMSFDICADCPSSVDAAVLRDRINAMAGRMLTIRRADPSGERMTRGYLADDPMPALADSRMWTSFTATLTILCPDPHWYGPQTTYGATGGRCRVENNGNADSYPVIHATGATGLSAKLDGHTITWTSPTMTNVDIDLADLNPTDGTLTAFDTFTVPPGGATITVTATPDTAVVEIGVRNAWR